MNEKPWLRGDQRQEIRNQTNSGPDDKEGFVQSTINQATTCIQLRFGSSTFHTIHTEFFSTKGTNDGGKQKITVYILSCGMCCNLAPINSRFQERDATK